MTKEDEPKKISVAAQPFGFSSESAFLLSDFLGLPKVELHLIDRKRVRAILLSFLSTDKKKVVITMFLEAYRYRAQFPWLHESGQLPGYSNGVNCALESAISGYQAKMYPEVSQSYSNRAYPEDWFERYKVAVLALFFRKSKIRQFKQILYNNGTTIDSMSDEQLSDHLSSALIQYYIDRDLNTSSDPW